MLLGIPQDCEKGFSVLDKSFELLGFLDSIESVIAIILRIETFTIVLVLRYNSHVVCILHGMEIFHF